MSFMRRIDIMAKKKLKTTLQLRKSQKVLSIALFNVLRTNQSIKELLEVGDRS